MQPDPATGYWWINGHRQDCAYIRSLDSFDGYDECDCEATDRDDWDDEEDDEAAA